MTFMPTFNYYKGELESFLTDIRDREIVGSMSPHLSDSQIDVADTARQLCY
jgi:hypothetical protein